MIAIGEKAPEFNLKDQFGRDITLDQFKGRRHVMLLFYPLDFTPTWSTEVPGVEALQKRFLAANTQVLGVSIDSIYCHLNWAMSLGGISFPLLADFHPKGAVASAYGLYLEDAGITDRATVIIDADGVVRHVSSVTPSGKRDIAELATLCEGVNEARESTLKSFPDPPGLETDTVLYVRSNCMFSTNAIAAIGNLHIDTIPIRNVSEDPAALADLEAVSGKGQAPCLVVGNTAMHEAADIMKYFAERTTDIGG